LWKTPKAHCRLCTASLNQQLCGLPDRTQRLPGWMQRYAPARTSVSN
jgi:hypothetical protein